MAMYRSNCSMDVTCRICCIPNISFLIAAHHRASEISVKLPYRLKNKTAVQLDINLREIYKLSDGHQNSFCKKTLESLLGATFVGSLQRFFCCHEDVPLQ